MSTGHTATPWKRDQYGNVKSEDGGQILLTGFALNTGHASKLAESNSDFVFRACNSHGDLVAGLQEAYHYLKFHHEDDEPHMMRISQAIEKAGDA